MAIILKRAIVSFRLLAPLFIIAILFCMTSVIGLAQTQGLTDKEATAKIATWGTELNQIDTVLKKPRLDIVELENLSEQARKIGTDAQALIVEHQPRVSVIQESLNQLSPKNGKDQVESAEVKGAREEQEKKLAQVNAIIKPAEVARLHAEDTLRRITTLRSGLFTNQLFERSQSVISPQIWLEVTKAIPSIVTSVVQFGLDWWKSLLAQSSKFLIGVAIALALTLFIILSPVRHHLRRYTQRDPEAPQPSRLAKIQAAIRIVIIKTILAFIVCFIIYIALDILDMLSAHINAIVEALLSAIVIFAYIVNLSLALLAPGRPIWRLIPVSDGAADRLMLITMTTAVFFVIVYSFRNLTTIISTPVEINIAVLGILSIVVVACIGWGLQYMANGIEKDEAQQNLSFAWRWVVPAAWIAVAITPIAAIAGYIAFANFVALQIVWTLLALATLYLLLSYVGEAATSVFNEQHKIGRSAMRTLGMSATAIEQVGVISSGIIQLMLIALTILAILAPFGIQSSDFYGSLQGLFFGFKVGSLTISLSSLVMAVILFILGFMATRGLQRWLENNYLPRTHLDSGLKNSIRTAVGYTGFFIAAVIALSYLGLSLDKLAIVAGALSLGIGFGLQSIINNFVSGLILLAERPIKTGDWIVVGQEQGTVRRISVRSTEIETFDRSTVIVPNSDLITGTVKNWMYSNTQGRITINIGVGYNSDPEQVRTLLLECAKEHSLVQAYPEPAVFFDDFGASSLDFTMYCYLADIGTGLGVRSDLRFAIMKRFREEAIEIPFPQRDVNIRNLDKLTSGVEK